jgi:plastocyanin
VPGELTVDLGQTVAFVNSHSDEHTATGSGFDTGIIPEGSVATVVLEEPGTFRYACQIHPEMTGQIAVRDANGVVPAPATPVASPVAGAATVRIANLAFEPSTITIPAGGTVTWRNDDVTPHTVTALDGAFDSGTFDPGASFSWTFPGPGTFAYQCLLHPTMQGSVVVEGEAAAAGSPVPVAT